MGIHQMQSDLRAFARERDWEQFHSVKNLVMALSGEAGELSALLQWVEPGQIGAWIARPANREAASDEIADVLAYLLQVADGLDIDLEEAFTAKLAKNAAKYPVEKSRGVSTKYTELG
ncbi:nucleotide pyrophosphohydrolase [Cryobacterium sp. MLB-32]|uniref:nucleotide pyrophosphohydrolase n=1 Tax=Cryobacterium sp. MLB-32 TaxID=1529318 RepID=UPI0004E62C3B|nr:nucleotide pyrophosphohydrolase [Cryobacterium sp. MLB-32]KFF59630.1 nucleotide pyrophosphohydrolase [Cryobacterium sp. MLB-32]